MTRFIRRVTRMDKAIVPRLAHLDLELTERCNNDCVHCCINLPANDRFAQAREMTTDQVRNILLQAAGLGCLQVRFTGGEPLLRRDFEDLYLFARRLGLKILIFTNARLITPRLADLLVRVPPLVKMEVTVYGMRRESYEAVSRVRGSFAQFRRGIDLLLDRRVPFVVKTALLPSNFAELDEFETWARTLPWTDAPPGKSMFFDLRRRRDDEEKNRLIKSLRLNPETGVAVLTRDAAAFRRDMDEFRSKFMAPPGDLLFQCGAGRGMCIDAYGRAMPCMGALPPDLTVDLFPGHGGKAGQPGLEAALDSFARLRDLKASNPDYLRRCAVCFLRGLCEQCPTKSWQEHGTLDTPVEYFCDVAHAQARFLGWIGENEKGWEAADGKIGKI